MFFGLFPASQFEYYEDKMAKKIFFASLLLLTITTRTESQFFDFYPNLKEFQAFRPSTLTPIQKGSSLEINLQNGNTRNNNINRNNNDRTATTTERTDSVFNRDIPFSSFLDVPERDNRRQFFVNNDNNVGRRTTAKPTRQNNSSQRNRTNTNNNTRNNSNNRNLNNNNANINNNGVSEFNNNIQNTNNNRNINNDDRNIYNYEDNNNKDRSTSNKRKQNENASNTNNWNNDDKPIIFDNNKNNNIFDDNYYTTGPQYNVIKTQRPKFEYNQPTTIPPRTYTENNYNRQEKTDRTSTTYNYNQYTTKPPRTYNNRGEQNSDRTTKSTRTEYTTTNPFYNRPGVKPPVYFNGPPITNKPIRPTTDRTGSDGLVYPEEQETPKIVVGPNEDNMSEVQKRRLIELSERMCDRYKSLSQKQVQAIPLLPSPDAVQVTSSCVAPPAPLIVGGRAVPVAQYPHSAAVGWRAEKGGYAWKCGGSLISEQFVLTAAHCSFQDRESSASTGPPEAVQLGSSYLNGRDATVYRISEVIRHPKYKRPVKYYDIALLKLTSKVTFTDTIRPACLGQPPPPGTKLTATGWGRTEFTDHQSHELRGVSLPVWDMAECTRVLGSSKTLPYGPSSDSQMCAGDYAGGKDTCQGDSGGPIQYRDGCSWRIAGVTSVGVACGAPRTPALYALPSRMFIAAVAFT